MGLPSKGDRRLLIKLAFEGSAFNGFQSQACGNTLQDRLEGALTQLIGQSTRIHGCSRTDAGVHAQNYFAHFDTQSPIPTENFRGALNALLPDSIVILDVQPVAADFHARFAVKRKRYLYRILNQGVRDPFWHGRAWHITEALDTAAMQAAGQWLVGEHDFTSFQATDPEPRNPVRTLEACTVTAEARPGGGQFVLLEFQASGFLKHMVRNLVGTLVEVGRGKRAAGDMPKIFAAKNRAAAGETAPGCGLLLAEVVY